MNKCAECDKPIVWDKDLGRWAHVKPDFRHKARRKEGK